jgi:hypothetical protein
MPHLDRNESLYASISDSLYSRAIETLGSVCGDGSSDDTNRVFKWSTFSGNRGFSRKSGRARVALDWPSLSLRPVLRETKIVREESS